MKSTNLDILLKQNEESSVSEVTESEKFIHSAINNNNYLLLFKKM